MTTMKDLTGQRFGRLTVQTQTDERRHKSTVWRCICSCGRTVDVVSYSLRKGLSQSCGCLRRDAIARYATERTEGKRFGRLVAVRQTGLSSDGQYLWECICDCGRSVEVRAGQLHGRRAQSCGCLAVDRVREALTKTIVTYVGAHARVRTLYGPARGHDCIDCGAQAIDWSYDGLDGAELLAGKADYFCAYSLSPNHYVPRCRACHNAHDSAARKANK